MSGNGESPSILILEDDTGLRETLTKMLTKRGYQVVAAGGGKEAVQAASERAYDLIITDIRMEGMDGLDALEQIKKEQPDIGSLVITGYSTEEDSIRAIRLGVGEYLKKPFGLPTLFESVGQILARRQKTLTQETLARSVLAILESLLTQHRAKTTQRTEFNRIKHMGETAEMTASRLGLDEKQALWVRLATAAKLVEDAGVDLPTEELPERLQDVLSQVTGQWESIPLEARIVAAVLEIHTNAEDYDPEVLSSLHSAQENSQTWTSRRRFGMLTVAKALMGKGRLEEAQGAFEALLDSGYENRVMAHALVDLSSLCQKKSGSEEGLQYVKKAVQIAHRLGPRLKARILFESATRWREQSVVEGWLEQSMELAERTKDSTLISLNTLYASYRGVAPNAGLIEHFRQLSGPRTADDLTRHLRWLLPTLVRGNESDSVPILEQWLDEFPSLCLDSLKASELDSSQALRILRALTGKSGESTKELSEHLSEHPDPKVAQSASRILQELPATKGRGPRLRILSLGKFQVFRGTEESTNWKTQKVRYLFAYLVDSRGTRIPDEELIEAFWPGTEPAKAKKSFNTALSFLRSHIRKTLQIENLVDRNPSGTTLDTGVEIWNDASEFRDLATTAAALHRSQDAGLEQALRQMLDLYQGDFLEGCYMDWADERRHQSARFAREAALNLSRITFSQKRYEDSVEASLRSLELDPCQEQVASILIQSYRALNRREEAVRFFNEFCQTLQRDLGLEADPELARLVEN